MARSLKKGPFVDHHLMKKIMKQKESGDRDAIKTWSRRSTVTGEFVGHTFSVHNGKRFFDVNITESMIGMKLGEFSPTRTFKSHPEKKGK